MRREEEKSRKEEEKKIGAALKEPDHYAECYPGMSEMNDAIDDSDEEADYTKMDLVISTFIKYGFVKLKENLVKFFKKNDYNFEEK